MLFREYQFALFDNALEFGKISLHLRSEFFRRLDRHCALAYFRNMKYTAPHMHNAAYR